MENGIIINIDPVLLRLGNYSIGWYSAIIMLAIVAAIGIALYEAKKKGISPEQNQAVSPVEKVVDKQ